MVLNHHAGTVFFVLSRDSNGCNFDFLESHFASSAIADFSACFENIKAGADRCNIRRCINGNLLAVYIDNIAFIRFFLYFLCLESHSLIYL
jgi:hypothetical protein